MTDPAPHPSPESTPGAGPYQYHPYGTPNPNQYPTPGAPTGPANGMGASALVLGLIGAALGWVPVLACVGWIACVLAIVFGSIGLASVASGKATNRRSTIAGLALGIAGLIVGVVVSVALTDQLDGSLPDQSAVATEPIVEADTEPAPEPDTEPETTTPDAEPSPTGIGAGTWKVGSEIAPGTYVTHNHDDSAFDLCTVSRLSGFSGEGSDIIAWETVEAGSQGRITIAETDVGVEFSGDCIWTKE